MKKLFDEIPYLEGERVVLRKIVEEDRETLWEMAHSSIIYRYEPTYLLEQQYSDMDQMFRDLYGECFEKKRNLFLGVFLKEKEEKASRNMLTMEVVIGFISTTAFLALLLFGVFAPGLSQVWRIVPCVIGAVIFAVSMHVCIKIEQTAGYYECPHCKHTFVPTLKQTYLAQHMGRTRKMVCPHCHKKGWCKKTLTKNEE